jgi:molybdenum cofactor cytidylyltransferase
MPDRGPDPGLFDPSATTAPASGPEAQLKAGALVLAAGASTRLGRPKQLIEIEGESLLRRTVRLALEAGCAPVCVVVGFEAERMAAAVTSLSVESIVNASWSSGMGSSLACGVAAARQQRPEMDALLVLVCDQPRLTANHLRHLLRLHSAGQGPVTASAYAGSAGVPAVFSRSLFAELERIDGDRGARALILRYGAQTVDWPEGVCDIDLPTDIPPKEPYQTKP